MIVETDDDVRVKLGGWDLAAVGASESNFWTFLPFGDEPKINFDCLPEELVKTLMPPKYYYDCFVNPVNSAYEDFKVHYLLLKIFSIILSDFFYNFVRWINFPTPGGV